MYSGTTFRNASGKIMGAHQKLDRVARRAIEELVPGSGFPTSREIVHFEGKNGPDGIKSKSPAQDEPWHYYNPADPKDHLLIDMITRHSKNLTNALKSGREEKAAFEAAWLAHAIVDGLTPAHHFPLREKLEELRGESIGTRTTIKDKIIVRSEGDTKWRTLAKNWEYWGAKGVMTTHAMFEFGFATTIAPLRLRRGYPTQDHCQDVMERGIINIFKDEAQKVYAAKIYDRFIDKGWTRSMAQDMRQFLAPILVKTVTLAWYEALQKSR